MSSKLRVLGCWICFAIAPVAGAFAASAKTYQVTGPVVAITPTTITVEKDNEKWEIARDPSSDAQADVKVGDRVTVQYRMHATKIEPKPGKADDSKGKDKDTANAAKKRKIAE